RDGRIRRLSAVPTGLPTWGLYPTLKRWAILGCPSGTGVRTVCQILARIFHRRPSTRKRSADFQSAVSQVSNLRAPVSYTAPCRLEVGDTAGWKPVLRSLGRSAPPSSYEISGLARIFHSVRQPEGVAQTSSLPYRRFPTCGRPSRTRHPADWKSATRQVGNPRYVASG